MGKIFSTKSECFRAWIFLWIVAFIVSFFPRIEFYRAHLQIVPNFYLGQGLSFRITHLWRAWDANIYIDLASKGYLANVYQDHLLHPTGDIGYFAFFPGWPMLLGFLAKLFQIPFSLYPLFASVLNLLFWMGSLHFWSAIIQKTEVFSTSKNPEFLGRFRWLFAFYPSALFCVSAYPEALFLFCSSLAIWALMNEKRWLFLLAVAATILSKHIGLLAMAGLVFWALLYRRKMSWFGILGGFLGSGCVFAFYYILAGDPLIWLKAQHQVWSRHFTWPFALFFDKNGGRGVDLPFYGLWLYLGPLLLAYQVFKNRNKVKEGWSSLGLFFTSSVYLPVWFGNSIMSIYRVVYLVPYSIATVPFLFFNKNPKSWRIFQIVILTMNVHAVYRFVSKLYLP